MLVHGGEAEQVLEAASHIMPVAEVHRLLPQMHALDEVWGVEFSGLSHAGAVMTQRHDQVSQVIEESVWVLKKILEPPERAMQPRGSVS